MAPRLTIKSVVRDHGKVIHETIEKRDTQNISLCFDSYASARLENGTDIRVKFYSAYYSNPENTLTVQWYKINEEGES